MTDAGLRLDNVTAGYGPTHVLDRVNLRLEPGERLAVIGRNGAGKTTLLATIMGLTKLHEGSITLNGAPIHGLAPHKRSALGLGLVPQTRDIFASLSVEDNLLSARRGDATLEEAYALFPRLKERRRNGGAQLSGGEQQMLAIARTLMTSPDILLLDEPLEGLAPVICDMLMETFETLSADGRHTLLLVEQHTELALDFADRVIILDAGEIVQDASAEALRADPSIIERHVGVGLAGA